MNATVIEKLTATRVHDLFLRALFTEQEAANPEQTKMAVPARGINVSVGFHPQRLEAMRAAVKEMLAELPEQFHESSGGGWSFLQMCNDKHDNHWGEQRTMQELCLLAIGLGLGEWLLPREFWPTLPGGMPYFVVKSENKG